MGKKYPFERTCDDEYQAQYKIDSVLAEYKDDPSWEIGEIQKNPLPDGKIQVIIDLTKLSKEELEEKRNRLERENNYRPRM